MAKRPLNVLYIHSHDTGRYVQPYGHAILTPAIQRLAEEGLLFRQAFCAAPSCSASRAALLTGQNPHSAGMLGLAHRGFHMTDFSRTLIHTLRGAGYFTALCGIQHIARDPEHIGYDAILHRGEGNEETAASFLGGLPQQPFFLDVGFFETHRRGGPDSAFTPGGLAGDARYCPPPVPLPDVRDVRRDMANFKLSAGVLDGKIARVLAAIDQHGLRDNTLVVCTTDHGLAFPHMKCNLNDHGLGVMLILRGPGGFDGGRVCDAMVSHLDLFPTVCQLAGIEPPAWLEGKSLAPLAEQAQHELHEQLFGEVTYHAAYEPMRSVRTSRWKYIKRFGGRTRRVMPNCDDGLSRRWLLTQGWRERPLEAEELYDLVYDPSESCNLAPKAEMAGVLSEMRARLDDWMKVTSDPLLKGDVPAPEGAVVTHADDLYP